MWTKKQELILLFVLIIFRNTRLKRWDKVFCVIRATACKLCRKILNHVELQVIFLVSHKADGVCMLENLTLLNSQIFYLIKRYLCNISPLGIINEAVLCKVKIEVFEIVYNKIPVISSTVARARNIRISSFHDPVCMVERLFKIIFPAVLQSLLTT